MGVVVRKNWEPVKLSFCSDEWGVAIGGLSCWMCLFRSATLPIWRGGAVYERRKTGFRDRIHGHKVSRLSPVKSKGYRLISSRFVDEAFSDVRLAAAARSVSPSSA